MDYIGQALLATGCALLLAGAGVWAGVWFGRLRSRAWTVGYFVPLGVVVLVAIPRWFEPLESMVPFRWMVAGRTEFMLIAGVMTVLLTTPLSRLPERRSRIAVMVFMAVGTVYFSVLPFLLPAILYPRHMKLVTRVNGDGVCLQATDYSCGPAAAVTALRRLAIPAEERDLAVRAHTTPMGGTQPDSLCQAIQRDYGVACEFRFFREVQELKGLEPAIAVVKFGFLVDHYVTVLSVTDREVTVGDPITGLVTQTHAEFLKRWRKSAIVFGPTRALVRRL